MGKKTLVVLLLAVIIGSAFAQELPRLINYQGKLTDPDGIAITGDVDITFRIYDAATGGTALWTETHSPVGVFNGLFDVQLGRFTDLDMPFDDEYWIELEVGGELLDPREKLSTVPYAFRAIYADTAYIIGSGAVQTDATIDGDGTDTDPFGVVWGSVTQHTDVTDAGSGAIITTGERALLHASGSDNQDLFNRVSDGTNTYTVATETDILTFAASGGAAVAVNPTTGVVTIDASSAGDDWGSQVVQSNATLTGTGVTGNLLGIAADGVNATHIDWGNGANQVDATDVLYFSGHDWNWIDPDPTNSGDAFDELAIKVESIVAGGGEPNQEITTGDGVTGADGGSTGDFTIDVVYGGTGTATSVARSDHNHDTDYDDYNSWNLQANGGATVGITSGANVNFAHAGLTTVSRSGNTITISSAGDDWGSDVVNSNATLTGNGTSGSPLGVVWGSVTQHSDVTNAGSGAIITAAERALLHAEGSDLQTVSGSGTSAFTLSDGGGTITLAGIGGATVTRSGNTLTIDAAGASDDWGSDVVNSNATLTGNGTSGSPLGVVWGSVTQHSDVTNAGSGAIITTAERGNLHAPGSDNQDLFNRVSDGTNTYTVATETDILTFAASGGADVDVNPTTGVVTIDASSAGDDWGSDVVNSNATLTGNGTSGSPLGVVWGSVTQHSDVTNAGSGAIITAAERALLHAAGSDNQDLGFVNGGSTYSYFEHTVTITDGTNATVRDYYDPNTDEQDLSYTAASRSINISGGSSAVLPLFSTSATTAGLVPGSSGATGSFLRGDGTWATPSTGDNNYVNGISFDTGTGVLTLTRAGLGNLTQDLDGRYLTGNQTITLTGDVTGSGATSISTTIANLAWSKLANGTANRILMTNGTGGITVAPAPTPDYYLKWNGTAYVWAAASTDLADHIAGNGLSGANYDGSGDVTWTVDASDGINVDASGVSVDAADGTIDVSADGIKVGLGAAQSTSTSYQLYRNY